MSTVLQGWMHVDREQVYPFHEEVQQPVAIECAKAFPTKEPRYVINQRCIRYINEGTLFSIPDLAHAIIPPWIASGTNGADLRAPHIGAKETQTQRYQSYGSMPEKYGERGTEGKSCLGLRIDEAVVKRSHVVCGVVGCG